MNSDINKGFDKGIDYLTIKEQFINELNKIYQLIDDSDYYDNKINKNKLIYLIISMIQLRNGSRISEACSAFREFIIKGIYGNRIVVKIAKSSGMKFNRTKKKKILMKARYRQMMFPKWIDTKIIDCFKNSHNDFINEERLRKRVLDYLLKNFDCNTHSLRYAYINYMLMIKKTPMNIVSKFVGHTTVSQLVTYTQNKNVEALFDEDM
jgi:integrase